MKSMNDSCLPDLEWNYLTVIWMKNAIYGENAKLTFIPPVCICKYVIWSPTYAVSFRNGMKSAIYGENAKETFILPVCICKCVMWSPKYAL